MILVQALISGMESSLVFKVILQIVSCESRVVFKSIFESVFEFFFTKKFCKTVLAAKAIYDGVVFFIEKLRFEKFDSAGPAESNQCIRRFETTFHTRFH